MKFNFHYMRLIVVASICSHINGQLRKENHYPLQQKTNFDRENDGNNITRILNSLIQNYDHRVRPNYGEPQHPTIVNLTLFILSFQKIDDNAQEFTAQLYLRSEWLDPRLRHNQNAGENKIVLDGDHNIKLWHPDVFFVNEVETQSHSLSKENELLILSRDGSVKLSKRITVNARCHMNLRYFPYDFQLCSLELESFGHPMKDLVLNWGHDGSAIQSVGISSEVEQSGVNGFNYVGFRANSTVIQLPKGNYSRLWVEFGFDRDSNYHFWTKHVPIAFFTLLSILPFFKGNRIFPAILTYLIGLMVFTQLNSNVGNIHGHGPVFMKGYILLNWSFVTIILLLENCCCSGSNSDTLLSRKVIIGGDHNHHQYHKNGWINIFRMTKPSIFVSSMMILFFGMNLTYWITLCKSRTNHEDISDFIVYSDV